MGNSPAQSKSTVVNMSEGPLAGKILRFAMPVMLSGLLQLLFNAADIVVVGQYAGSDSLAAVGSTSSLINLLVNLFIGISVGTNVVVAQYFGANDRKAVSQTVHTAILLSIVSGIVLVIAGLTLTRPILEWMGTPDDVLDKASLYVKIYFLGMPAMMLYNFGSAILRAVGDTKRPMYFLIAAGVLNISLNMFFVIVCNLDVAGVGMATSISQCLSAVCIFICLMKEEGAIRLDVKKLSINRDRTLEIVRIGLPAGLQSALFSISNVLIQSSVNSFGSIAMAGNTAAASVEGFVYIAMNSFYQAAISFVSQNFGARKFRRISKILYWCLFYAVTTGIVLGWAAYLGGNVVLRIYSDDMQVIEYGVQRLQLIITTYFLCGIMEVIVGCIRGMGCSIPTMFIALLGACVFRIVWIFTVFQAYRTLECLYISYPVSWVITSLAQLVCFIIVKKRAQRTV